MHGTYNHGLFEGGFIKTPCISQETIGLAWNRVKQSLIQPNDSVGNLNLPSMNYIVFGLCSICFCPTVRVSKFQTSWRILIQKLKLCCQSLTYSCMQRIILCFGASLDVVQLLRFWNIIIWLNLDLEKLLWLNQWIIIGFIKAQWAI